MAKVNLTNQEIFDRVVVHAKVQGKKATIDTLSVPVCQYRTPDGKKCFVGALIPDEDYTPSMEGSVNYLCALGVFPYFQEGFLRELQHIHDFNRLEKWAKLFRDFAERHTLDPSVVDREYGVA